MRQGLRRGTNFYISRGSPTFPQTDSRVTNRLQKSDRPSHLSGENLVALVNFDGVTFCEIFAFNESLSLE